MTRRPPAWSLPQLDYPCRRFIIFTGQSGPVRSRSGLPVRASSVHNEVGSLAICFSNRDLIRGPGLPIIDQSAGPSAISLSPFIRILVKATKSRGKASPADATCCKKLKGNAGMYRSRLLVFGMSTFTAIAVKSASSSTSANPNRLN